MYVFCNKEMTVNQYQPKPKTITDDAGINVIEVIIADCSPRSVVKDFQSSFVVQRTSCQSDT